MPTASESEPRRPSIGPQESNSLLQAFSFFTKAAGSLEKSYLHLEAEVCRLRRELEEANQDLQREREERQRVQALAEISTLLAHEIRNPLGSLELFASLLADSGLCGAQLHWVHNLQAGLRTLAATVNNVLQLHIETPPAMAEGDLGELLHWAVDFLTPLAEQNGMGLELRNDLRGVSMPIDVNRLRQVLLNLALNAFRFMKEGGQLHISGFRTRGPQGEEIRMEVRDDGSGIAPGNLPRIFDSGFTTRPGSAGLGLAVSRKIVEQHKGRIEVASAPGEGATFTLVFSSSRREP